MAEKSKEKVVKVRVSTRLKLPSQITEELEDIKEKFRAIFLEKVDALREGDKLIVEEADDPEEYEIDY